MPGVAVASPVVEVDAKLAGRDDTLRIVGIDVFRAGLIQPGSDRRIGRSARHAASGRRVPEPGGDARARRRRRATS